MLPLAALGTLICGVLVIAVSGAASGVVPENGGRHVTYVLMLLIMEGVLLLMSERPAALHLTRLWPQPLTPAVLVLAIPLTLGLNTFAHQLPIRQGVKLGEGSFPVLQTQPATGCAYYVADNAQQVYGYFIRREYRQAPLVLNLKSGSYTLDAAVDAVCGHAAPPR